VEEKYDEKEMKERPRRNVERGSSPFLILRTVAERY